MLQPVRTKYRKALKAEFTESQERKLNYGQFGLKAIQPDRIIGNKLKQLEWLY